MQNEVFRLKVQQIQVKGKGKALQQRIRDLEELNQHQADEIYYLEQETTPRDRYNSIMATPDPQLATTEQPNRHKEEGHNDERYSTPQREIRHNDEGEKRYNDEEGCRYYTVKRETTRQLMEHLSTINQP